MVLDGQVVAEGIEGFDLVLDEAVTMAEDFKLGHLQLQAAGKIVAQRVEGMFLLLG